MAKYFPNENTFIGHCNLIQKYLKKNYTTMCPTTAVKNLLELTTIRKQMIEKYFLPGLYVSYPGTRYSHTFFRLDTIVDDLAEMIMANESLFKRMEVQEKYDKIPILYNAWEVKQWFMLNIIGCDKEKYNIVEFYNDLMK